MMSATWQEKLQSYLSSKSLKSTRQRDAIIETFFAQEGSHISIDDLMRAVHKTSPGVGYATVYRTLMLLVDAGLAQQRHFSDGQSLFEPTTDHHHDHLICTQCGKIIEFENDAIEKLQEQVAAQFRFDLTGHKMELYGTCQGFRKNGVCDFDKSKGTKR